MFCHAHNLNQSVFKYKRLIEKAEIPMRSDAFPCAGGLPAVGDRTRDRTDIKMAVSPAAIPPKQP
jgi:hypothetical protein